MKTDRGNTHLTFHFIPYKISLNQDFKQMRLKYIFRGQEKEPHPFYVKSHWEPPVQPSVALENYLDGSQNRARRN